MRKFSVILLAVLCLVFSSVPALALTLDGGYYVEGDSAVGTHRFYFPADFKSDSLTLSDSGYVYNLSGVSGYFYCPDLPDYTFRFDRFGELTYRAPSRETLPLNLTVSDSNITFMTDGSTRRLAEGLLICLCLLLLVVSILIRR